MKFLSKIAFAFLSIYLSGCSTTQYYKIKDSSDFRSDQEIKLPKYSEKKRQAGKITLLPHQYYPIDYLLKHPKQKGLLINHYLGTGKTFLGLGFAEKMLAKNNGLNNHKIILIVPRFLKSNWVTQMRQFGVKDKSKYEIMSIKDAPGKLLNRNLRSSVVIIDEVHKMVQQAKNPRGTIREKYSNLFLKLKHAHKILALTGTPIFSDASDIVYLLNLVSGQDLLPYNAAQFKAEYTYVEKNRGFWRGHFAESMVLNTLLPPALTFSIGALIPFAIPGLPIAFGVGTVFGAVMLPFVINNALPIETFPLRRFNADKLKDLTLKYTSFYTFGDNEKDFPALTVEIRENTFSLPQLEYFLDYAELALDQNQLATVLRESGGTNDEKFSKEFMNIDSTPLQEGLMKIPGNGREIGNFSFKNEKKQLTESPKYEAITDLLHKNLEKTVIYSNYYENGILLMAEHLKRHGFGNDFQVVLPDSSIDKHEKIIDNYNSGKKKILLLHPDITEGISLKGTQYFHVLEPVLNNALLEQILGRAVRYQSHIDLPKEKQQVKATIWKSVIDFGAYDANTARIKNWHKRYAELNPWAGWGPGMQQVDKNHKRKQYSPDEIAFIKLIESKAVLKDMRNILETNSIEHAQ